MTADRYLSIGQLAAQSGRSRRTIDFYSRNGLLPFVRSEGGHRLFRPETLQRLTLIDVYKASRLRLDEIRRLLDEPTNEHATQVAEIDDQLTRLSAEVLRMRADGVPLEAESRDRATHAAGRAIALAQALLLFMEIAP
ncbi:MAG: MerR family transcriptional regulator, copper efflux regulator [Gaiellales bacterium]|nr:MerR family transcriptional regulator, copper efflux regulator [Gaiellales bacterium]